ncbi:MAG TPA: MFS transporter [Vicinamibacteria bacterium]|nr:MFS transporter [Vicinamibacteria bacterium]
MNALRGNYRWWIGGLLFLSTVINYLDRQTLNVLGPSLKTEFSWSNQDFALIIIAFRIAYTVMQTVGGRILDRLGTRKGLTLTVAWYSAVASLTAFASGLWSFCAFRFLLGAGEAANWPGATKAVSEWFPRRQRGLAVALFDSGSSVGAMLAPALMILLMAQFGGWRPAFLIVGTLGFFWLFLWRRSYHTPETHPKITEAERAMILADHAAEHAEAAEEKGGPPPRWSELLRLRQTWGAIAAKGLTDPVWFMIADWFAIYLVSKGYSLEQTAAGYWVPFLASGLGNFAGGGFSGRLIRRGWSVGRARRLVIAGGALGVLALVPAAFASSFVVLLACFAVATFSYAAMSTMANSLPADLYQSRAVATVAGLAGTAAGLGTIGSTYLIGVVADRFSFTPILVVASLVPFTAALLVLALVRNTAQSGRGVLKVI